MGAYKTYTIRRKRYVKVLKVANEHGEKMLREMRVSGAHEGSKESGSR